jgi:16S rRNA (guanine527-N7)-methyltransferase
MSRLAKRKETTISDELIRSSIVPFGFEPSPAMVAAIRLHVQLLQKWNKRISLTSLEDTREILERHFGESVFAVNQVPILHGRLADVGSGGGFPGLPIKMAVPDLDLILIESNTRKAAFLSEVIRTLGISNARVLNKRMEEIDSLTDSLDFVIARALGDIPGLLRWSKTALGDGGKVVLWLGERDSTVVSAESAWTWRSPALIPGSKNRALLIGAKV